MISLVFHILTAARTITFSDSGDFLMAIGTVGNCHGPGYPLYLMTARLFCWLVPVGSLAFRASLYSGIFASITVCLIYQIVYRIRRNRFAGVVASAVYCFSYTYWYQSTIPETYSLNTFFIALLIVLIIRWERLSRKGDTGSADNTLCLFAFCFGLALANHITVVLLLPAFLFFALDTDWRSVVALRNLLRMAVFLALGLLPYVYQPAAALRGPAYNYGDPSTLTRWFQHMTLYYQRGGLFGYPYQFLPARFLRYFGTLNTEFPYFAWLGGLGLLSSFTKRQKKYPLFLALLFLLALVPVLTYSQIEPVLRAHFYYTSYLIFSLWIGLGAGALVTLIRRWSAKRDRAIETALVSIMALLLLSCPVLACAIHYRKIDKSSYFYAHDMATNMLDTCERGAVLLTDGDNVYFPCRYLQVVEGVRQDVRTVNAESAGTPGFEGKDLLALTPKVPPAPDATGNFARIVDRNFRELPVYSTSIRTDREGWNLVWEGFVLRVLPENLIKAERRNSFTLDMRGADRPIGDLDSDTREALSLPNLLKANRELGLEKDEQAVKIYRRETTAFQEDLYVPTLYSCATFTTVYQIWGSTLNRMGRYADTVRYLPDAKNINPDYYSMALATAMRKTGDIQGAINELKDYLVMIPEIAEAHSELGEAYFATEQYRKALAQLEQSIRIKPSNPRYHFLSGLTLLKLKRNNEAKEEFESAILLDREGIYTPAALDYLERLKR